MTVNFTYEKNVHKGYFSISINMVITQLLKQTILQHKDHLIPHHRHLKNIYNHVMSYFLVTNLPSMVSVDSSLLIEVPVIGAINNSFIDGLMEK